MNGHILLVDDDVMMGKLLTFLLTEAGYAISVLADPRLVRGFLEANIVDLILMDVMLPHGDGYAMAADIRRTYPDIPIIFLTARASLADKVEGYARGADDYIAKPFEPTELLARVQAVLGRYRRAEHNVVGSVIRVGDTQLNLGELEFRAAGRPPVLLTPTEMKILECLMHNAESVITRQMLMERTWGFDFDGLGNRVDVYIRRLRSKIEPDPGNPSFIQTVRGLGYLFHAGRQAAVPPTQRAAG